MTQGAHLAASRRARHGRHARRAATCLITTCLVATTLFFVVVASLPAAALKVDRPIVAMAATPDGGGYWEVASDGGIFAFGDAVFSGSRGGSPLSAPIVSMAATPSGHGYWEVGSDGGVFAFGDAVFWGSTGNRNLNRPVVGMAATPSGHGYWLVSSDGGIFAFGDAVFSGSMGGTPLTAPIVGMAATPSGHGYWEVASDGGVFAFGDAVFWGSTGNRSLNRPVVGMAATPSGHGYWLVSSDGGVFSYGDAVFSGSMGGVPLSRPIAGTAAAPSGYWEAASDGGIFSFGGAPFHGSTPELPPPGPPRIALYGDSLASEAIPDFTFLAGLSGASVRIGVFPGTSTCNDLGMMMTDAQDWQPTAAVLEFAGNPFAPCMSGDPIGTPQYFAKYRADTQEAISIFRSVGTKVVLVGLPLDSSPTLSANVPALNGILVSLAADNVGVTYDDAGQAVMANGAYTSTLPCLPTEPCTGPSGTNVVRAPDGVHFCPDGHTALVGVSEECDVYSSGAFRFAAAMLGPTLTPPSLPLGR